MRQLNPKSMIRVVLVVFGVLAANTALAADTAGQKIVDGILLYYSVVPAELIRGYSKDNPEAAMHGGAPSGTHAHHVLVALFDRDSRERITDAVVTASVREIGLGATEKPLEPFTVADALTYGNYFDMPTKTIYHIDVKIRRPGLSEVVDAQFDYRHH